jgi:pyrroline-5-carboxylate reductase
VQYGVLGVGEIATAIVTGLCEGVEAPPGVLLSPRNPERAAALAARHPSVSVAADNQALIDGSSVLVLAIRPQDVHAILGPLRFRHDQPVISLLAGVSLAELAVLVAPADDLARAIPLPPVARRAGITAVHRGTPAARSLFGALGGVVVVDDPDAFEAMSAATATIAAHIQYVAAISGWLSAHGVAREEAERYVASMFAGVAEKLRDGDLAKLARVHATPGGSNERFAALLEQAGTFDLVGRSLDAILERLRA